MPVALILLLVPAGTTVGTTLSTTLIAAGMVLCASGELVRLWAVHHIGVISRTRSDRLGPLITSGPFAFSRNPLYAANISLWIGFALSARLVWMAPIVLLVLGAEYHAIVRWEEQVLESRHGDAYRAYAALVPRWIPSLKLGKREVHSAGQQSRGSFSWNHTLYSERGTLVAIAVGYALLWMKTRFS